MVVRSEIFKFPDEIGNELVFRILYNEYSRQVSATVYLKLLNSGSYPRQIGYIDIPKRTFHCFRDSHKHLHVKSNSYGFNYCLTDERFGIEKINVRIDKTSYVFDIELLNNESHVLNFKSQGFEVQKFLAFDTIKKYRVGRKTVNSATN
jgi:hypothetical protein